MKRRQQKFSRSKSRTAWLAWLTWAIIGSIFVFEDVQGGSGWLTVIITAPFWILFAVWPFLWVWLVNRKSELLVEIDDDISTGTDTARLVQKNGVRYVEVKPFSQTFNVKINAKTVQLPGGEEIFVEIDRVRPLAKDNERLQQWLNVVDDLPTVR